MPRDEIIEIEVEVIVISELSITVSDGRIKTALPKSQLEEKEPYDFKVGDVVEIHIPLWLAEDRNLV